MQMLHTILFHPLPAIILWKTLKYVRNRGEFRMSISTRVVEDVVTCHLGNSGLLLRSSLSRRLLLTLISLLLCTAAWHEPSSKAALHAVHSLLLCLLLQCSLLLEPLLAILTNHLLNLLVVALSALARNVLQHLALSKCVRWVDLAIGNDHQVHVLGLETEQATQCRHAGGALVRVLAALGLKLLVKGGASETFAARELGWDVLVLKGLENLAHVGVLHGVDVFEERDQAGELLVLRVTFPGWQDNGVLGLSADVRGIGVDNDYFG